MTSLCDLKLGFPHEHEDRFHSDGNTHLNLYGRPVEYSCRPHPDLVVTVATHSIREDRWWFQVNDHSLLPAGRFSLIDADPALLLALIYEVSMEKFHAAA